MTSPLVSIRKVSKTYYKKKKPLKEAVKKVSFDILEGEVLGLLGINGAGKTTLSSIIASLHPPSSGDVLWNDQSIYDDLFNYRRQLGFCPQHPNIDQNLSIQDNLFFAGRYYGMSKQEAKERCAELMERFDLARSGKSLSSHLSGGQRQRFILARTLMHSPKLVILDEPTVGLDPHIRRTLWEVIKELRTEGVSVLLTTHYLDEAEFLSDRICLLHEGTIRTIDTPDNLKKKHQKNNLEEVFLKFVDDPEAEIFNSVASKEETPE